MIQLSLQLLSQVQRKAQSQRKTITSMNTAKRLVKLTTKDFYTRLKQAKADKAANEKGKA